MDVDTMSPRSKLRKKSVLQRRMAWLAAGIEAFPEASGTSHAFAEISALRYVLDLIDADTEATT